MLVGCITGSIFHDSVCWQPTDSYLIRLILGVRLGIRLYLELARNLPRIAPFADLMFSAIGSRKEWGKLLFVLFFLISVKKISFIQKKGLRALVSNTRTPFTGRAVMRYGAAAGTKRRRQGIEVVEWIQRFGWRGALVVISASCLFLSLRCLKI